MDMEAGIGCATCSWGLYVKDTHRSLQRRLALAVQVSNQLYAFGQDRDTQGEELSQCIGSFEYIQICGKVMVFFLPLVRHLYAGVAVGRNHSSLWVQPLPV